MWEYIHKIYHKILKILHLSPFSLAEKCRVAFGAAVVLVLILALLLPYIWMGQLTKNAALDVGRAKTEMLLSRHFQRKQAGGETALPALDGRGTVMDANNPDMQWIQFAKEGESQLATLTDEQKEMIKSLKADAGRSDNILLTKDNGVLHSNYIKIFRATESCINCHNPQGPAKPFSQNELIGAVVIQRPADEINRTVLLNRVWIIIAGLIAGTGAIVAFYVISQRVILRPIRQLRAIANNVAEGNLDIRSAIQTGDEYERLAEAFNHMLDGLQAAQEKLRQANKQLDAKIAELSERNIELFKANKIKGEFLANISHEFRTPLNAILGFAEILREKPELLRKDKGQRYAENIITGGKSLLNMINDLLNLAKAEAGKMEMHIEKTSIPQLCRAVVGSFSALTKKKKIKVKLTVDDNIPVLSTDAGKVQQILYNFLSNSVKFTPEKGRIEIRVNMQGEQMVRIAVSDTGCGIAELDKEKLFKKFSQADGSITRQSAGSGLGLAISKELAAMLAGAIGVESEAGKGSTFWLDIPVTLAEEKGQAV
ncbi:MAG: ATP-binding protein [Phycisphaerae bacterium]|nr:ATP-binding protein [Phycisphaerae bacterium]MDD5380528.1 ATP-binding protein [Phycisphaerae bacterium]